jgi:hypothetical protein
MGAYGLPSRCIPVLTPEDLSNYGHGRLREDADGVLLSTGTPIDVSLIS